MLAEAFEIYWAAIRSGLYITAVNWHLSAEEAAYIVARQRCAGRHSLRWSAELAEPVADLVPEVQHWYSFGGAIAGYRSYAELLASDGTAADRPAPRFGDALLVGHHRSAQGHQAAPAADPGRRTRRPVVGLLAHAIQDHR